MARLSKFSAICHTCGKSSSDFIRRVYFENHIKSHEAGVAYICESCGKGYSTLMDLKNHIGKYHKECYKCIQCDKSFISSGEQRYFKIMKYVKNEDKCDMTIFNSKKVLMYK